MIDCSSREYRNLVWPFSSKHSRCWHASHQRARREPSRVAFGSWWLDDARTQRSSPSAPRSKLNSHACRLAVVSNSKFVLSILIGYRNCQSTFSCVSSRSIMKQSARHHLRYLVASLRLHQVPPWLQ